MWCPSLSPVIFFTLRSILSNMRIAIQAFFSFLFAWNVFFHPFAFNLYVSLGLNGFLIDSIYMDLIFLSIQPVCLLVGTFNPFAVIIDIYVPIFG